MSHALATIMGGALVLATLQDPQWALLIGISGIGATVAYFVERHP